MVRKTSLFLLLLCLVTGTTAAVSQEKPAEAWWLNATFAPTQTAYEGINASAIDPNWSKMSVLSYDLLPAEAKGDLEWMRRDGFMFVKEWRVGEKGLLQRAVAGVFEDRSGKSGRFLLLLRRAESGGWEKAFLHEEPGDPGFSVLVSRGQKIYWGTCMQCENFRQFVVTAKGASLK